jgi:hypothetical protein
MKLCSMTLVYESWWEAFWEHKMWLGRRDVSFIGQLSTLANYKSVQLHEPRSLCMCTKVYDLLLSFY